MAGRKTWICLFLISFVITLAYVRCEEGSEPEDGEKTVPVESPDGEVTEEEDVLILTDKNFDDVVNTHKVVLVEFYAPWCGHCKQLAPEYAKAAGVLKKADPAVPLAKVDCTIETAVAGRFDVSGYPTLKLFRDGKPEEYEGPRDAEGIVSHMKEKSDPNYKPPPEAVMTLTKDNFKEITDREEIMLVEFYAPWCGHCKTLAPKLEIAAKTLQGREEPILIGKVDATVEDSLAKQYGVTGYPTLKVFRKGVASEYKGPREEPGISDYMISNSGVPTTLYETIKEVKVYMKSNKDEPVVLGVFDDENDPLYKLFIEANNELRDDFKFGHTFSKDVKKMFVLKKESAIVMVHPAYLISNYEKRYQFYTDASGNSEAIQEFYKKYQVPLVGHFQQRSEKRFTKRPLVLVFFDVNFDAHTRSLTQYWRDKVLQVAREYPNITFAVANEEDFDDKMKDFGIAESGEDVNVGLYDEAERKFALRDEEFSEESLTQFIESWKKGKLKPNLRSQAPVPRAKPGKVQVVVAKTFDEIVMDETKEVFIEFYAPWCGHCKKIAPHFHRLAEDYVNETNIVIAIMDSTENEIRKQYRIRRTPKMFFALPGRKTLPIRYSIRTTAYEDLKSFVEGNSRILKEKRKAAGEKAEKETEFEKAKEEL